MHVKHSACCLAHSNHSINAVIILVAISIIVLVVIISPSYTLDFVRLQGSIASLAVLEGTSYPFLKPKRRFSRSFC